MQIITESLQMFLCRQVNLSATWHVIELISLYVHVMCCEQCRYVVCVMWREICILFIYDIGLCCYRERSTMDAWQTYGAVALYSTHF